MGLLPGWVGSRSPLNLSEPHFVPLGNRTRNTALQRLLGEGTELGGACVPFSHSSLPGVSRDPLASRCPTALGSAKEERRTGGFRESQASSCIPGERWPWQAFAIPTCWSPRGCRPQPLLPAHPWGCCFPAGAGISRALRVSDRRDQEVAFGSFFQKQVACMHVLSIQFTPDEVGRTQRHLAAAQNE